MILPFLNCTIAFKFILYDIFGKINLRLLLNQIFKNQMGPYLAHPCTQKHTMKDQSPVTKLRYYLCQMQGWRRNMEDAAICECDLGDNNSLFAVFDGHGGPQVSKFVQKIFITYLKNSRFYKEGKYHQALDEVFRKIDEIIDSKQGQQELKIIHKKLDHTNVVPNEKISVNAGCTANVVLITPKKIIVANAGDSRSVLCKMGKAYPLSNDNKPDNPVQLQRIKKAGGVVVNGRVQGGLNLSRSFGDFSYKTDRSKRYDEQIVTCKPQITEYNRTSEDQFIIVACDGIWQKHGNDSQSIITRLYNEKRSGFEGLTILKNLFDFLLAKQTNQQSGCDNMTAIIVQFMNDKQKMRYV